MKFHEIMEIMKLFKYHVAISHFRIFPVPRGHIAGIVKTLSYFNDPGAQNHEDQQFDENT